uniref:Uncharacterized protein n=1 Tax=Brassica oleracea TaxID=3712 RepID=A0A3P6E9F3_BRAOL|nr:unnamed protein product [Brassica oleracea]
MLIVLALYIVEGLQFDNGYLSSFFVTDNEKMAVEFDHCKLLLVDMKIANEKTLLVLLRLPLEEVTHF